MKKNFILFSWYLYFYDFHENTNVICDITIDIITYYKMLFFVSFDVLLVSKWNLMQYLAIKIDKHQVPKTNRPHLEDIFLILKKGMVLVQTPKFEPNIDCNLFFILFSNNWLSFISTLVQFSRNNKKLLFQYLVIFMMKPQILKNAD